MQVRNVFVAHHAPGEDLQELTDSLNNNNLRAAMGPDAVVLAVGCLENLEGRLVAEDDMPPVLDRTVLAFLRLYEISGCTLGFGLGNLGILVPIFGNLHDNLGISKNCRW